MAKLAPNDKEPFIKDIFNRIARHYDLMNLVMTAGVWRYWQAVFRRSTGIVAGDRVLDVGCGTGDLTLIAASQVGQEGRVIGIDLSPNMLAVGRAKVANSPYAKHIELREGNALALDFPDASFDVVTTGFAMRNVADLPRALREMARVLRPGGRLLILELSHPRHPLLRGPFFLYFRYILPKLGFWAKKSKGPFAPYAWLPASLETFPDAHGLSQLILENGFQRVDYRPLTGGIVCLHIAVR